MNKGLTVVILLMVLSAMGSVMYAHLSSVTPPPAAERPATPFSPPESAPRPPLTNPLNAPQGDRGGLDRIAPPITSGQTPGAEGAPRPVNLTAGADGTPARPVAGQPVPQPFPPRETARVEGPTTTTTPPRTTPEQEQAPIKTPPPVPQIREKPSDGSPGLTPWTAPAPSERATPQQAQTPPTPQTQTPPQDSTQLAQRPETVLPPRGPQRGAVTDPIRPTTRDTAQTQAQAPRTTQQKPVALSEKGTHTLKSIAFRFAGQSLELVIQADSAFPCKTFSLTGPDRLVIDLPGVWKGMRAPALPQNRLVKNVRLGQQSAGPRLVLDLTGPLKGHSVERDGATVTILLR